MAKLTKRMRVIRDKVDATFCRTVLVVQYALPSLPRAQTLKLLKQLALSW